MATPRASPRTRPAAASTSSSASAATARSTRWPRALAGTAAAIGVLPGGSTNVFARTIGLPNDPVEAARHAGRRASPPATSHPIGLGHVNGRYFCFHTGVGFDAAVVRQVETRASLKRWVGHPLFIYAGVRTWARGYDRKHPHFTVSSDGARRRDPRVLHDRVEHQPVHVPRQPSARPQPGGDARAWPGGGDVPHDARSGPSSARSAARCAAAGSSRASTSTCAPTCAR